MDSRTTLKTYAERWMVTTLAVDDVKDSTRRLYRDTLRLWVLPHLGHRRLSDLRPGDIEEMQTTLIGGGLSPSSAQGAHKVLRRVLSTAVRDGLIARNPVLAVRGPSIPRSTKKVPDRADVRRILDAADGRMRPLVALLAFTGMRVGEALALRWSDIDLTRGTVQINGTLARDRDLRMLVRTPPKTERSRRTLPLPAPLITELRTWRRVQSAERLAALVWATEEDWVVTTNVGTASDPTNVSKVFGVLATKAGSGGTTFHSLRHSTATTLLEEGVPMRVVSELLGHANTRLTEDLYSHVTARLTKEASDALTRALGP
jgi:integrase